MHSYKCHEFAPFRGNKVKKLLILKVFKLVNGNDLEIMSVGGKQFGRRDGFP